MHALLVELLRGLERERAPPSRVAIRIRSGSPFASSASQTTYAPRADAVAPTCPRASAASAARARARPGRPRARARPSTRRRSRSRRPGARTRGSGSRAARRSARPAGASARPRRAPTESCVHAHTDWQLRERREAHGRPHVVGEDQERRAVRLQHPVVQRDAVDDRAHRVLADAEGDVAAGVRRREDAAALELRLRRLDEVGGAADHRRREALERLHHLRAGVARRDAPRPARTPAAPRPSPAAACRCAPGPSPRAGPGTSPHHAESFFCHCLLERDAAVDLTFMCSRTSSGTTNFLSGSQPSATFVARTSSSPSGEPCALRGVDGVRRAERDVRADDDQRRPLRLGLRVRDRLAQRVEVVRVVDVLHVPALRLEARAAVLGEGDRRRAVDRDVVVVVEVDELAEAERARRSTPPRSRRLPSGRRRSRCSRRGGRRSRRTAGCSARRGSARRSRSRRRSRSPGRAGPSSPRCPACDAPRDGPGVSDSHCRKRFSSSSERL